MPNDLIKNPLKIVTAANAEAIIVLFGGRRSIKAVTNTIADAKTAKGIQYVTALEGLSAPDSIPVNDSFGTQSQLSNIS